MLATFTLVSLVASVLSIPTARQVPSGPCAHFFGGFDTASNFTLAALNRTLPNANSTGTPLSLPSLQGSTISGASLHALSASSADPNNSDIPLFSLVKGGLIGASPDAQNEVSGGATNGSEVTFLTSLDPPAPAQVYCAVANTDPAGGSTGFPTLALDGETDLFSLCMNYNSQNNVVYNATADNSGHYDFDTCYAVTLQLIGLPK